MTWTLVVGCDASGKSTLLDGIHDRYGDMIQESVYSSEALAFKRANKGREIDTAFLDEREAFYLEIEQQNLRNRPTGRFATLYSTLTTRIAHDTMRRCIGERGLADETIIQEWERDERTAGVVPPELIACTHALFSTIYRRIEQRQQAGARDEEFWGFNAPFFLERYQERWVRLMPKLAEAGYRSLLLDTSDTNPDELLVRYIESLEAGTQ